MDIRGIKSIETYYLSGDRLPYRIRLIRDNDSVVDGGGLSWSDAIVIAFATGGYGRFPPPVLAEILEKKFEGRFDPVLDRVIYELKSSDNALQAV